MTEPQISRTARERHVSERDALRLFGYGMVLAVAVCFLLGACGDSGGGPTATPSPRDPWGFYRSLQPGDCLGPRNAPVARVPCDSPSWSARVYAVYHGEAANTGSCPNPEPPVDADRQSLFQITDLLLCYVLREPLDP